MEDIEDAFEAYLVKKKIDSASFASKEGELWQDWKSTFDLLHPDSFTAQKLYLINEVRRRYPYSGEKKEAAKPVAKAKPKFVRKKTEN